MGNILQLRVSLNEIKPEIWRRFLIEDSVTFEQLHKILQGVMGWEDSHLYEFRIGDNKISSEEDGFNPAEASFRDLHGSPEFMQLLQRQAASGVPIHPNEMNEIVQKARRNKQKNTYDIRTKLIQVLGEGKQFAYTYDFGDMWQHNIIVEKITEKDPSRKYPRCLEGERECPPEDCGSVQGYYNLMRIRKNKKHPRYNELIVQWLGEDYDPELFVVDWVNARLHGKKPKLVWMPAKKGKDEFVQLGLLLKKNISSTKQMRSLFNREEEYEEYLGEIECTIATYFLENRTLKDKEVEAAIKNLKKNYLQKIDFFTAKLEKEIMQALSLALQEKSITHHELKLVFDYVLLSIDNRSWIPDKQAYLKWLPYFFDMYTKDERDKFRLQLTKLARRRGLSKDMIDDLLDLDRKGDSEELRQSQMDSEFFSLDGKNKYDYIMEHGLENPYIVQSYLMELETKGDYTTLAKLLQNLVEISNGFPIFEFLLGVNYWRTNEKAKGQQHMEHALKSIENAPDNTFPVGEKEVTLKNMREEMKRVLKTGK